MSRKDISWTVKTVSLIFSLSFLIAVPFACAFEDNYHFLKSFLIILSSPCPLVTDYFELGSIAATFLNAGLCGAVWTLMLFAFDDQQYSEYTWSGYFLVVAHCFYGLNLFNMWPSVAGILFFCRARKLRFRDNLDKAMVSTAFGPFFSELVFRYPTVKRIEISLGCFEFNLVGVLISLILGLFLGFVIPALLQESKRLHKGYNLYNAGLAFGLLGLFISSFLYKTMEVSNPVSVTDNISDTRNIFFCNSFFVAVFVVCIITGYFKNGKTLRGYAAIMNESGHQVSFFDYHHCSLTLINLGFYGLFMVIYFNFITVLSNAAGWTGATCGVTLAAVAFSAGGQHPRNVWPILTGFVLFDLFVIFVCFITGMPKMCSLASQCYLNAAAFATGLCPFVGHFGIGIGILAGFICAVLCTSTMAIHCGLMLYNGGFTAGITATILTQVLTYYSIKKNNLS